MVTTDKNYLGKDNIDKFDALIFKIQYFRTDEKGKDKCESINAFIDTLTFLAKAAIPTRRSPNQWYIMSTQESSSTNNNPPLINNRSLSRYQMKSSFDINPT